MINLTKKRLEQYRDLKGEIQELKDKIDHLANDDSLIGNDVINDYRTGYPRPQAVVGIDRKEYEKLKREYNARIVAYDQICLEIEDFIGGIDDSQLRRIFRMRYIDGMRFKDIGKKLYLDRSSISKKIDGYLKDSHISRNSRL